MIRFKFLFLLAGAAFFSSANSASNITPDECALTTTLDNCTEAEIAGYIYVENRSAYSTSVYINSRYVGWLRPGAHDVWAVYPGCVNVTTVWDDGDYNYWNPCVQHDQTYSCFTGR